MTFAQLPAMDHVGLVVDDLEKSMSIMSGLGGFHWADPMTIGGEMTFKGRLLPWQVRVTYSIEGPVHFELIQQIDSTGYETLTDGRLAHHVGFTTASLRADSSRLSELGLAAECGPLGEDSLPVAFVYHLSVARGVLLELMSTEVRAAMQDWVDGGPPVTL
jgi:hypothetical protein